MKPRASVAARSRSSEGQGRSGFTKSAVTGDTPVVLISGDAHHAWLNTTALLHLALPVRDWIGHQVASYLEFALATPIILWAALPFFNRGWDSMVNRSPNMWTLISLGVAAAYAARFLYGPRLPGFGAAASIIATMSASSHSLSVTPAAIAGVTRSVW